MLELIILIIITFSFCTEIFHKLISTIKVDPESYVYFDIKKFNVDQKIKLDFKLPDYDYRVDYYSFKIGQSNNEDYQDLNEWNNLKTKTSKCASEKGFQCFYEWTETKLENSKYILIIPLKPLDKYMTEVEIYFANNKATHQLIAFFFLAAFIGISICLAFRKKCKFGKLCKNRGRKNEILLKNNNTNNVIKRTNKKTKITSKSIEEENGITPGYTPGNTPGYTPENTQGYTPGYTSY